MINTVEKPKQNRIKGKKFTCLDSKISFNDWPEIKEMYPGIKESDLVFAASENTQGGDSGNRSESQFDKSAAIVMTAKDAVKCGGFKQNSLPLYAIDVSAKIDSQMTAAICAQLAQ